MSENNFEEMLSRLASNPELINKVTSAVKSSEGNEISDTLPNVLSILSEGLFKNEEKNDVSLKEPSNEVQGEQGAKNEVVSTSELIPENMSRLISTLGREIGKNTQLLLAIKPYLNKNRQGLIETIVKLSSLAGALGAM